MKKILLLNLLFISTNWVSAQSIKISVPEVKESLQIDTIVEKAVVYSNPNKSCLLIDVHIAGQLKVLSIIQITTNFITIDLGNKKLNNSYIFNYKSNLRYFKYKGYTVFVTGSIDPYQSFTRTQRFKEFSFTNIFTKNNTNSQYEKNHRLVNYYEYKDGTFISLLMPVY